MFSYYGSKTNLVKLYPRPKHGKIIEPFAGAAKYALEYFDRDILLVDKYEVVVGVWKWLQQCSPSDILSLPKNLPLGTKIDSLQWDCKEQRDFYGFIIGCASSRPVGKTTVRKTIARPNFVNFGLNRVAKDLFKIKHWDIKVGDYRDIPNETATWFIDPPYQFGGDSYPIGNKKIDFKSLSEWSMERAGQVIVCENTKADWMDFKPMIKQRGSLKSSTEAIWSNERTAYDFEQQSLFP